VYLDFEDAIKRLGRKTIEERYGNLFDMYFQITGENPYEMPMRIYPAIHYTMGGLWVDYHLQSTIPGLFVLGEANFSDHGANRLGASALMQGLSDGYFVIPYTLGHYLASTKFDKVTIEHPEFKVSEMQLSDQVKKLLSIRGKRTTNSIHRQLGNIMWDNCGMARNAPGLQKAIGEIQQLREEFWQNVNVLGDNDGMNQALEHAGRLADFLELGELMCRDALHRNESCGGHFREEYQTPEGEADRDDANFSYAAAWEYRGMNAEPVLHKEPLTFEYVHPSQRSYK
jgi:succinate dehydrogenase / fumarate reductase flavoprotein subunit